MNISDYARQVLMGGSLADKLLDPSLVDNFEIKKCIELPILPGREKKLITSDLRLKFPKAQAFHDPIKRAQALHSFANHELLAIEMMAAFILCVPHSTDEEIRAKKSVLATIRDEQKHLGMYLDRIRALGADLGDWPLSEFFWGQMRFIKTPGQYFAVMALTFESANLDFSEHYAEIFRQAGDLITTSILEEVHLDEISHVALGVHWLGAWKGPLGLWDYYRHLLPNQLTPARAKGLKVSREARSRAGLPEKFINALEEYRDEYRITHRKSWGPSSGPSLQSESGL
jgi:uncharacterized ferritin-like protein (DUF455 family)